MTSYPKGAAHGLWRSSGTRRPIFGKCHLIDMAAAGYGAPTSGAAGGEPGRVASGWRKRC